MKWRVFALGEEIVKTFLLLVLLSFSSLLAAETAPIGHDIQLSFDADSGQLAIKDTIALPQQLQDGVFEFALDTHFAVKFKGEWLKPHKQKEGYSTYQVASKASLTLSYSAQLASNDDCDWLMGSCLKADAEGLFLAGDSAWYPRHLKAPVTISIHAELPEGWHGVSQGLQDASGAWVESLPQQSITFMAAPYRVYTSTEQGVEAQVYLRQENNALAQQYLDSTHRHLQRYSAMFGDYPYAKFATVESFWQTGWGLPSMTLLGGHVMRLPFILETSLPHEILHSWWGNGVYVDSSTGNWSEGLTSYLADYAYREQQGQGAQYRREQLQQYASFVDQESRMPLAQFTSRHDHASQAIGYGQAMMLFHEIRQLVGESVFQQKLNTFFSHHQFHRASFETLIKTLLDNPQDQVNFIARLYHAGAVKLSVSAMRYSADQHAIQFELHRSGGHQQPLRVPVDIAFKEGPPQRQWLDLKDPVSAFEWSFDQPVCTLSIDPNFDVFRQLLKGEAPATLKVLRQEQPNGWRIQGPDDHALLESMFELTSSKLSATLWMGPWESLPEAARARIQALDESLFLQSIEDPQRINVASISVDDRPFVWVSAIDSEVVAPLFGKLPHYGKYSYLAFDRKLLNKLKGQWLPADSPLRLSTGVCQ